MKKRNPVVYLLPLILCLITLLTGCVRYDVGVTFNTPYQGKIVQHITTSEQFNSLSPAEGKKWLNSIEGRSRDLGGKVQRINSQEMLVTIPFGNGKELTEKFNQLFHSHTDVNTAIASEKSDLLQLDSQIALKQNNLVFLERNRLDLTIDLRALDVLTHQGKITISPDSLIDLQFQLNTSLVAYNVAAVNNLEPKMNALGKGLVWQLQPGEINHIEAVFWLPSPLGIGAAVISLLTISGYMLKYRRFPGVADS